MKNYTIIGIVLAIILGILAWWWFVQVPRTEAPTLPAAEAPSPAAEPAAGDTTDSMESDLEAAAMGDIEADFNSIDGGLNGL